MKAWLRVAQTSLVATLAMSGSCFAQVYRCVGPDGRIEFSNLACPSDASVTRLNAKTNSIDTSGSRTQALKLENRRLREQLAERQSAHQSASMGARSTQPSQAAGNVCPSDNEIRNMQVSASSITRGEKEKTFLEAEIRRARQCQKGQGNYSAEDWKISREAQGDQNSIKDQKRGRARAEGMHSAADPIEGDRIQLERLAEQQRRASRAGALANNTISSCDNSGCWNTSGQRFQRINGTDRVWGPSGNSCRVDGRTLRCP